MKLSLVNDTNEYNLTNAHIAVMYSGGLDSTLIAYICGLVLPPSEEIDLLSLSFSGSDSIDRKTSLASYEEL